VAVAARDRLPFRRPAAQLDRLVDACGRPPDPDRVRVLWREGVDLGEYPEAGLQVVGVDAGHAGSVRAGSGDHVLEYVLTSHVLGAQPHTLPSISRREKTLTITDLRLGVLTLVISPSWPSACCSASQVPGLSTWLWRRRASPVAVRTFRRHFRHRSRRGCRARRAGRNGVTSCSKRLPPIPSSMWPVLRARRVRDQRAGRARCTSPDRWVGCRSRCVRRW
jgi:hypothetical protein